MLNRNYSAVVVFPSESVTSSWSLHSSLVWSDELFLITFTTHVLGFCPYVVRSPSSSFIFASSLSIATSAVFRVTSWMCCFHLGLLILGFYRSSSPLRAHCDQEHLYLFDTDYCFNSIVFISRDGVTGTSCSAPWCWCWVVMMPVLWESLKVENPCPTMASLLVHRNYQTKQALPFQRNSFSCD